MSGHTPTFAERTMEAIFPSRYAASKRKSAIAENAMGNSASALALLEQALEKKPKDPDILCDLGQVHYGLNSYDEAERLFRLALDADRTCLRAKRGLAFALHSAHRLSEAIFYYQKCLDEQPDDVNILINMGAVLHDQRCYTDALEFLSRAEKMDSESSLVYENRALCLYELGDIQGATEAIVRALKLDPNNTRVESRLALILEASGESEKALEHYQAISQREPNNAAARIEASRVLVSAGRYAEAALACEDALVVSTSWNDRQSEQLAYWNLGWVYYVLGDLEASVRYSTKALEVNPKLIASRFNLALALLLKGDYSSAITHYEKGIADLSQASDLKYFAIDDLENALAKNPDILRGTEALQYLRGRFASLKQGGRLSTSV